MNKLILITLLGITSFDFSQGMSSDLKKISSDAKEAEDSLKKLEQDFEQEKEDVKSKLDNVICELGEFLKDKRNDASIKHKVLDSADRLQSRFMECETTIEALEQLIRSKAVFNEKNVSESDKEAVYDILSYLDEAFSCSDYTQNIILSVLKKEFKVSTPEELRIKLDE